MGQLKEEYEAKEERMHETLRLTRHLAHEFDRVEFIQVHRSHNMEIDEIAKKRHQKQDRRSQT